MSRKGKYPIKLPKGVDVNVDGNIVRVKGPKGTLEQEIRSGINVTIDDGEVSVQIAENQSDLKAFQGLYWSLINNMVTGTSEGFEKKLELQGVGYRAVLQGQVVDLQLGFSHPTKLDIPEGLSVAVEKGTKVTISGTDRQMVGQFAAKIRALRPPEPYKGKGVRYVGEYVRRKAGKSGK